MLSYNNIYRNCRTRLLEFSLREAGLQAIKHQNYGGGATILLDDDGIFLAS